MPKKPSKKKVTKKNIIKKTRQTKKKGRKQKGGSNDALNMLVREGSLEELKDYVKGGGDVNQKGSLGITALMEAVIMLDKNKVQYLLSLRNPGVDVNAVSDHGHTAYSYVFGNDDIVKMLKDAGANTDPVYLLLLAIEKKNNRTAKTMIDNRENLGLDIDKKTAYKVDGLLYTIHESPLLLAIKENNLDITRHLLDAGANLNIVSDIEEANVMINNSDDSFNYTPLMLAVSLARLDDMDKMVDLLLEYNGNPERDPSKKLDIDAIPGEYAALHIAMLLKDQKTYLVKRLIEAGADINLLTKDYFKNTPLILAGYDGDLDTIKLLVDTGADVSIENSEGVDVVVAAYEDAIAYAGAEMDVVEYFAERGHEGAMEILRNHEQEEEPEVPEEPKKKDTQVIVQQIQPVSIEDLPATKTVPKALQDPNPSFYDVIDMEEKNVEDFLKEDPENIMFVYEQQMIGTNKKQLQHEFTTNRTKIMLECIETKPAFHQPDSNIVKDNQGNIHYYLNMDIIGLLGIMINIAQLKTLVGMKQVPSDEEATQPMSISSPEFAPGTSWTPGTPETPEFPPGTPDFPPDGFTPEYAPDTSQSFVDMNNLSGIGDDLSPINRGGDHHTRIFVVDKSEDPKKMRPITSFGAYDMDNVVSAKHCAEEEPIRIGTLYSLREPKSASSKKKTRRSKSKSKSNKKRTRRSKST